MSISKQKFTAADLIPDRIYRITAEFKDYDGIIHPIDETWKFTGKNFLPYEDGLSIFIERDGQNASFRLQWREETQAAIIDHFSNYVEVL